MTTQDAYLAEQLASALKSVQERYELAQTDLERERLNREICIRRDMLFWLTLGPGDISTFPASSPKYF